MAEAGAAEAGAGKSDLAGEFSEGISGEDLETLQSANTAFDKAASNNIASEIAQANDALDAANKPILEAIEKVAKTGEPITEEMVKNSSSENPPDQASKNLRENVVKPSLDIAEETIKNAQEANGESGKALEDSPKTKAELLKKYGPTILKLLAAIALVGFGIYELDKIADEMSGCYKFSTTVAGTQEKIGCSESTCNCNNISQCGANNTPCTQANGLQYIWRKYTALDALCQLPALVMNPIASGLSNLLKPLKEIVIGIVAVVAILLILFLIYKFANKKLASQH